MKKLILTFAVLMGVSSANTFANNGMKIVSIETSVSELNVKTLGGLKFKLSVDNLQNRSYIAIKNEKGEVFHTEYVGKASSFVKVYDLSNLPDGEYFFEVGTGKDKLVKPFEISTTIQRAALPK